jgi:hypothetical protein
VLQFPKPKKDRNVLSNLLSFWSPVVVSAAENQGINQIVVAAIRQMPVAGKYRNDGTTTKNLIKAFSIQHRKLILKPQTAEPSYCSSATYIVFVKALLDPRLHLQLDSSTQAILAPKGESDGDAIWGRWNANGPGTPCLFHELKLGTNFTDISKAKAGDFMKISWNGIVGDDPNKSADQNEKGHSAIFLGSRRDKTGAVWIDFWTSNDADYLYPDYWQDPKRYVRVFDRPDLKGYSCRTVLLTDYPHLFIIFARLEHPETLRTGAVFLTEISI